MMIRLFKFVATIIAVCSGASQADAWVGCGGHVMQIQVRADSTLEADWGYGWRAFCQLRNDINTGGQFTTKEACQGAYAQLQSALDTGLQFFSYHSNSTTCTQALAPSNGDWMTEAPYSTAIVIY